MRSIDEETNFKMRACLYSDVDGPIEDRALTVVRTPQTLLESR